MSKINSLGSRQRVNSIIITINSVRWLSPWALWHQTTNRKTVRSLISISWLLLCRRCQRKRQRLPKSFQESQYLIFENTSLFDEYYIHVHVCYVVDVQMAGVGVVHCRRGGSFNDIILQWLKMDRNWFYSIAHDDPKDTQEVITPMIAGMLEYNKHTHWVCISLCLQQQELGHQRKVFTLKYIM